MGKIPDVLIYGVATKPANVTFPLVDEVYPVGEDPLTADKAYYDSNMQRLQLIDVQLNFCFPKRVLVAWE